MKELAGSRKSSDDSVQNINVWLLIHNDVQLNTKSQL